MSATGGGLVLVEVGGRKRRLVVPASGQIVVGADPRRAGLLLVDEGVEKEHCRIGTLVGGGFALRDLGSPSGTKVNGQRVQSKRIVHGDRIQVGSVELRVIDSSLEPLSARQPSTEEEPALSALDELHLPESPSSGEETFSGTIGGYRIIRTLGRGAFGSVLLTVQESLQRETALKLLSPKLEGNAEFVRRFQEEARAAASLSHPNVVIVYDVGEAEGHHFLSMEYMAQGSLENRLRREGQLKWSEVVTILIDAARGLVYAEQRGIVHRDIKPANLMLSEAGVTKISDLGLAVSLDAASKAEAQGTAHFVSPEQARGEAIDHRTDLYSLGATAFRLLTGQTPFGGNSKREILSAVFNETPPRASEFAPDTPPELDELVARLLLKSAADRPQSARILVAELEHIAARAGQSGHGASAGAGSGGGLLKLALAILALVSVALGTRWFLNRPSDQTAEPDNSNAVTKTALAPPVFDDVETDATPGERLGEPGSKTTSKLGIQTVKPPSQADDQALLLLENKASQALLAVAALADGAARVEALQSLRETYRGTDAAVLAETQLAEIRERKAGENAVTSKAQRERQGALAALRATSLIDEEGFDVIQGLIDWKKYKTPLPLLGDTEFAESLAHLKTELINRALREAQAAVDAADQFASTGDFEAAANALAEGRQRLGLEWLENLAPDALQNVRAGQLEDEQESAQGDQKSGLVAGLGGGASNRPRSKNPVTRAELDRRKKEWELEHQHEIQQIKLAMKLEDSIPKDSLVTLLAADERLKERALALPTEELAFLKALNEEERRQSAGKLHAGTGLESELRALDFGAISARLTDVTTNLKSDELRSRFLALAGDIESFRIALRTIRSEYDSGNWRRRALADPSSRRAKAATVVGATESGWLVGTDSAPELVSNAALVGSTAALDLLFNARINRDYTPAELNGIASGMRLAAVLETLVLLQPAFSSSPPSLKREELESYEEIFDRAREWARLAGDSAQQLLEERAAVRVLSALADSGEEGWTSAVQELDSAVSEGDGSLFILLLTTSGSN